MFEKTKNFLKNIVIFTVVATTVLFSGSVYAGLNGGISTPVFFYLDGVNLIPQVATTQIGSSVNRIAKIWATDADITNMIIGSITNGNLIVGGTASSTITGDGTASTFGGGLNINGTTTLSASLWGASKIVLPPVQVITTDGTTTGTLYTSDAFVAGQTVLVEVVLTARNTNNYIAQRVITFTVYRQSTGNILFYGFDKDYNFISAPLTEVMDLDTSAQTFTFGVLGAAGQTINWTAYITLYPQLSS